MEYHDMEKSWKSREPFYSAIDKTGSMGAYADSIHRLEEAFREGTGLVVAGCIDGRLKFPKARRIVRLAGAGALVPDENNITRMFDLAGVAGVYSHGGGCGAADMAKKDAAEIAKHVAKLTNRVYLGHLPAEGPHTEIVAYVDGTGRFDPSRVPQLPQGYVLSWRFTHAVNPKYALFEASLPPKISFGPHGFGTLFSRDTPFYIVPIGDPHDERFSLEALTAELKEIPKAFDGRVVISGFTAPKYR